MKPSASWSLKILSFPTWLDVLLGVAARCLLRCARGQSGRCTAGLRAAGGARAGCQCLAQWNYTSSRGNLFHVRTGCANPDGDMAVPWCFVDRATCQHEPVTSTDGPWDQCYSLGDTITIDTGAPQLLQGSPGACACCAARVRLAAPGLAARAVPRGWHARPATARWHVCRPPPSWRPGDAVRACVCGGASTFADADTPWRRWHWAAVAATRDPPAVVRRALTSPDGSVPRGAADKTVGLCSCKPSWAEKGRNGTVSASAGSCVEKLGDADVRAYCDVIPETCAAPPQRRLGTPWDVCQGARAPSSAAGMRLAVGASAAMACMLQATPDVSLGVHACPRNPQLLARSRPQRINEYMLSWGACMPTKTRLRCGLRVRAVDRLHALHMDCLSTSAIAAT